MNTPSGTLVPDWWFAAPPEWFLPLSDGCTAVPDFDDFVLAACQRHDWQCKTGWGAEDCWMAAADILGETKLEHPPIWWKNPWKWLRYERDRKALEVYAFGLKKFWTLDGGALIRKCGFCHVGEDRIQMPLEQLRAELEKKTERFYKHDDLMRIALSIAQGG